VTGRQAIAIVARREVVERVRDRSFAISTLVTVLIVAAIVFLPSLFGASGPKKATVAVSGQQAAGLVEAARAGEKGFDVRLATVRARDDASARALVRSGDAEAAVLSGGARIVVAGGAPSGTVPALQAASARERSLQLLRERGVEGADAKQLLSPRPLPVSELDEHADARKGFAFVALIVLYGQILAYGFWVAAGVVEEKASRIVEILLAAIRSRHLLAGKVLGIGIVGVLQLLLISAIGLALASASGRVHIGAAELSAVPVLLAFFVLGFALYACAFAVGGALVPRQEDLQSATTPITLTLVASFFLSFAALDSSGSVLAKALTYVPLSAPLVTPVRVITGDAALWEALLSGAIVLAAAAALIGIAGRIYSGAVLQTRGRVRLRAALRAEAAESRR
jgi:ABC-2 type transport system permease protein